MLKECGVGFPLGSDDLLFYWLSSIYWIGVAGNLRLMTSCGEDWVQGDAERDSGDWTVTGV